MTELTSSSTLQRFSCSIDSVENYTELSSAAGVGALIEKFDIKFHQIPARKSDGLPFGFQINCQFFSGVDLPSGCCSSPFLFSHFDGAIHWIVKNTCHISSMLDDIDDFLMVG
jgi:hypothetical protein